MRDLINWRSSQNIEDRRPALEKQAQGSGDFWGWPGSRPLMDLSQLRVPIASEYRLPRGYGLPSSNVTQVKPPPGGVNPDISAHENMGWPPRSNPQGPPMPAQPSKPWF